MTKKKKSGKNEKSIMLYYVKRHSFNIKLIKPSKCKVANQFGICTNQKIKKKINTILALNKITITEKSFLSTPNQIIQPPPAAAITTSHHNHHSLASENYQ